MPIHLNLLGDGCTEHILERPKRAHLIQSNGVSLELFFKNDSFLYMIYEYLSIPATSRNEENKIHNVIVLSNCDDKIQFLSGK